MTNKYKYDTKRERTGIRNPLRILVLLMTAIMMVSCAGRMNYKLGNEAVQKKDWDKAVEHYLKALQKHPGDIEYRIALSNALISASNTHMKRGKQFLEMDNPNLALRELQKSLEFNPENNEARRYKIKTLKQIQQLKKKQKQKTDLQKLKTRVHGKTRPQQLITIKSQPFSLKFKRIDVTQIFKVLQRSSGINFVYDSAFKPKKIDLHLEKVQFLDALEKITLQINAFYKVLDARTIIIIPDTRAKRKDYEELVIKTFFLSNAKPDDLQKLLREITGLKTISVNKTLNTLTIKGTPEQVKLAGELIQIHDKPAGEIYLDVEIIEVNRNRVKEYGIELSNYSVTETYSPVTGGDSTNGTDSSSTIRLNMLSHTDASDYLLSLPSVTYKLLKSDSRSRIKARPQLRVVDQEEVEVRLGDKVPIPTTSFVPYNTGGLAQQPITSYQLEDVGINIKITPRIHHDGLITLKMEFELTFITTPGSGGVPPTLGKRSVKTIIKLKDNETSILAGLLRDTERKTMSGFPLLSRVPVLKEIFSGNKNEVEQTDIILTITPRIIRFPEINEEDLRYIGAGTMMQPGYKDLPPVLKIDENGNDNPRGNEKGKIKGIQKRKQPNRQPNKQKNNQKSKQKGTQKKKK